MMIINKQMTFLSFNTWNVLKVLKSRRLVGPEVEEPELLLWKLFDSIFFF